MGVNGIYGLSGSGLDVESMVKVGMMSKQSQLEKMQQTYTKNEWKKDAFLEVYDKIQDYNTSTLSTFTKSANMNARTATSSNALISASADSSAPTMNHTITVNQTATNAFLVGTNKVGNRKEGAENSTKFLDLTTDNGKFNISGGISFTIADGTGEGYTAATYASASVSSTSNFFSTDAGTFHSFLQTAVNSNQYNNVDTEVALKFEITGDSDSDWADVDITYGDIYTLLNNESSTVQDFVDLLNNKIQSADNQVDITASYDSSKGLTFENTVAAEDAKVYVDISVGTGNLGNSILTDLYNNADTDTQHHLFSEDGNDSYMLSLENTTGGRAAEMGSGKQTIFLSDKEISNGATFYDLMSKVNSAGTNIRMNYDAIQDKFSIYNMKTGSENSINISATDTDTAKFLTAMGFKDTTSSTVQEFKANEVLTIKGTDAEVLIDGDKYTNINSNSLKVNGVTYTFGNVTQAGTTAVVTVDQDKAKIIDNVKSFVESYNTLLGELQDMYRETPNSSYAPLTDAQKAEMTEEQIKKWEEKAKSGMLYHDSTLRKIIDQMRTAVTDPITGLNSSYDRAYSIGISTTGLQGKLQLDEDKLREALTEDPDSVYKIFATLNYEVDKNGVKTTDVAIGTSGIGQRLSEILNTSLKSIKNVSGTSKDNSDDSQLSTLLRNLQTKMSSFQSMMNAFEESLYKKYDAMESTLAMLGSQLNYVTGMFA